MTNYSNLHDYDFYARNYFKINTKLHGLCPFVRRVYQKRFTNFLENISGPKRVIVVKPRQAGFSTDVAGFFTHKIQTRENYKGILLADKFSRTKDVMSIYQTYVQNTPKKLLPMIAKFNTEEILFKNPNASKDNTEPGLNSGVTAETAIDPNAGRAGTRMFSHQSEAAFYRYALDIDEGVSNSIPLHEDTYIIKESTANGRSGIGKPFYDLYQAAKAGNSIYKSFFVAWYEIDDYVADPGRNFDPTKYEKEIMKEFQLTAAHCAWRRLKLGEYMQEDDESFLTPEERFKQDFPLSDSEAFLSTGQPVFPVDKVNRLIESLSRHRPVEYTDKLKLHYMIDQFKKGLKIYHPPRQKEEYYIGADVSEGLATGDASSAYIMDSSYKQVARWHGKIDPDMFGHLLVALGEMYNNALLVIENNNMGHTTVTTVRNSSYPRIYKEVTEDARTRKKSERYGYRTTGPSRDDMLNEGLARFRDGDSKILDIKLPQQMGEVARGDNGKVDLGGKDRVVAYSLACIGRRQIKPHRAENRVKPRLVV